MRGEYPFAEELSALCRARYDILPQGVYVGEPDAVVLCNPTPEELSCEIERRAFADWDIKIIAVSDAYISLVIRTVVKGVYSVSDAASAAEAISGRVPSEGLLLTKKETLLLSQLKKGLTNKELGAALSMSERTVRRLKCRLLDKTGLVSASQLAVLSLLFDQYSQLFT